MKKVSKLLVLFVVTLAIVATALFASSVDSISAPQNVKARASADRAITVTWNSVSDATLYNVYRFDSAKNDYVYKNTVFATAAKPTEYVDKNLTGGVTYSYKILAAYKTSEVTIKSPLSAAASAEAIATPAAPTGVTAKATGDKTITVNWTASAGATLHNIYRFDSAKNDYVYKGTVYMTAANPTEYVDKNLTGGETYSYKILAAYKTTDLTLKSGLSSAASAKAIATPAAPTGVTAKATADKTITVNWTASAGATLHNIYRFDSAKNDYVYKGTVYMTADKPTEYVDKNLTGGTTYSYKILAAYKTTELTLKSDLSAAASAKAIATPAAPTGVAAKATADKTITVTWTASAGATLHNIYRFDSAKNDYVYKGTVYMTADKPTEYVDKNLTGGATYSYKILAAYKTSDLTLKSGLSSAASAEAIATPSAPTGVTAKATDDKTITVTWTASAGATLHNIYRFDTAKNDYVYKGTVYMTAAKPTEYVDKNLTGGATYSYKILAAYKTAGLTLKSDLSAAASAKAIATPAAPTGVAAKASGDRAITITWNSVAGATLYNVYRYDASKKDYVYKGTVYSTAAKPTEYVDKNLGGGYTYYYKVLAAYKTTELTLKSGLSTGASAKAIATPAAPTGVQATASAIKTITVTWNAVSGATLYNVYRYNSAKNDYVYKGTVYADSANPTEYVDKNLTGGETYSYKILSAYKTTELTLKSGLSAAASAVAYAVPAVPSNVEAAQKSITSATVSWGAVSEAQGYYVQQYVDSAWAEPVKIESAETTSYDFEDLEFGTECRFRVASYYDEFISEYSEEASVTLIIPKVSGVEAEVTGLTSVTVTWNDIGGISGYEVYDGNEEPDENGRIEPRRRTNEASVTLDIVPGESYGIYIKACLMLADDVYRVGEASEPVSVQTEIPQVTGVSAVTNGITSVTVSWDSLGEYADIKGYDVCDGEEILASTTETSADVEIAPGVSHSIVVKAFVTVSGHHYDGPASESFPVETSIPQVTGLNVSSNGYSALDISWSAVNGVDGYDIYDGGEKIASTEDLSLTVDVLPGEHVISVKAFVTLRDEDYQGPASDGFSIDTTVPKVTGVNVTVDNINATYSLSWNEVPGVDGYIVSSDTAIDNEISSETLALTTDTSVTISVAKGIEYYLYVRAYVNDETVEANCSREYDVIKKKLPATPLPKVKDVSAVSTSPISVNITWATVASGLNGYYVQQKNLNTGWETIETINDLSVNSYAVNGLATNADYTFRVVGFKGSNIGWGQTSSVRLELNPISNLLVNSVTENSAELTWTPSTTSNASGYRIYNGNELLTTVNDMSADSYTMTGLEPLTLYNFKVKTYYSTQEVGADDAEASVTTAPSFPTEYTVYISDSFAYVRWNDVPGASGFYLYSDGEKEDLGDFTSKVFSGSGFSGHYAKIVPYYKADDGRISEYAGYDYSKSVNVSRENDGFTNISWDVLTYTEGESTYNADAYIVEVAGYNGGRHIGNWTTVFNSVNGGGNPNATSARVLLADNFDYIVRVTGYKKSAAASGSGNCVFSAAASAVSGKYSPRASYNVNTNMGKTKAVLSVVQAINNTKDETGTVSIDSVTNIDANVDSSKVIYDWGLLKDLTMKIDKLLDYAGGEDLVGDLNSAMGDSSNASGTFRYGNGTVTVTEDGNSKSTETTIYDFLSPQGKLASLYNAENVDSISSRIKSVSAPTVSNGKTTITFVIAQETATPNSSKTPVHEGLVEGFADAIDSMGDMDSSSYIKSGDTTVKAVINADGTLDSIDTVSPFEFKMGMAVNESLGSFDIKRIEMVLSGTASYKYTLSR